jgi:hypothetical protein
MYVFPTLPLQKASSSPSADKLYPSTHWLSRLLEIIVDVSVLPLQVHFITHPDFIVTNPDSEAHQHCSPTLSFRIPVFRPSLMLIPSKRPPSTSSGVCSEWQSMTAFHFNTSSILSKMNGTLPFRLRESPGWSNGQRRIVNLFP